MSNPIKNADLWKDMSLEHLSELDKMFRDGLDKTIAQIKPQEVLALSEIAESENFFKLPQLVIKAVELALALSYSELVKRECFERLYGE